MFRPEPDSPVAFACQTRKPIKLTTSERIRLTLTATLWPLTSPSMTAGMRTMFAVPMLKEDRADRGHRYLPHRK